MMIYHAVSYADNGFDARFASKLPLKRREMVCLDEKADIIHQIIGADVQRILDQLFDNFRNRDRSDSVALRGAPA